MEFAFGEVFDISKRGWFEFNRSRRDAILGFVKVSASRRQKDFSPLVYRFHFIQGELVIPVVIRALDVSGERVGVPAREEHGWIRRH